MFLKIRNLLIEHIKINGNKYFLLFMIFVVGISAGAFTVNGLSTIQREELMNYFQGFLHLFDNQQIDSMELFKIAFFENMKIVAVLWILGIMIIGIPFIFILIGIKGFIIGFGSGFIIEVMGVKGVLFAAITLFPKEILIIPCIIALGVYGVNFSLDIIKTRSGKKRFKQNIKGSFFAYCFMTAFLSGIVFLGVLIEAYITPVFIRIIAPVLTM